MAMWSPHRVVKVVSKTRGASELLGTGTIVAPGRVLTARHVVFDEGRKPPGIAVARERWSRAAKVAWDGGDGLDVVLLSFDGVSPEGVGLDHVLDPRAIKAREHWSADGYPEVTERHPTEEETPHIGETCAWSPEKTSHRVFLVAKGGPDVWSGLSGAAVVIDERVVAVIAEMPRGYKKQRLCATPVARFWGDATFRAKLSAPTASSPRDARVAPVVAQLHAGLSNDPEIARVVTLQLVALGRSRPLEGDLARTLVEALRANELADVLNGTHHEFTKRRDAARAESVWRMLLRILPVLADWHQLIERAAGELVTNQNAIELPLRSETIAEIVIAGVEGRECRFGELVSGAAPVGVALVHIPAAADVYIDPEGKRRAQLMAADLAAQMPRLVSKRLASALPVRSVTDRHDVVLKDVEGELAARQKAPGDERMQYYVVFFNDDLGDAAATCDEVWQLSTASLRTALPSLRLVRLRGDADPSHRELGATITQFRRKP